MNNQEIFRRLSDILSQIEQNQDELWLGGLEDAKQCIIVADWLEELKELNNQVRDNIK